MNTIATIDSKKPSTKQELIAANIKLLIEQLEAGHSEALTNYLTAMSRFHKHRAIFKSSTLWSNRSIGGLAELADAGVSKTPESNLVSVRFRYPPPIQSPQNLFQRSRR